MDIKTMKNIDLYYRICIFLALYNQRKKFDDLGGFLGVASMISYRENPFNPIGLERRMVDVCIWHDWLRVIGLEYLVFEPITNHFSVIQYIKKTGDIEIQDDKQFDYLLNFLKYIEQDWDYDWKVLYFDLNNDLQTKKEWDNSLLLLKVYLKKGFRQ